MNYLKAHKNKKPKRLKFYYRKRILVKENGVEISLRYLNGSHFNRVFPDVPKYSKKEINKLIERLKTPKPLVHLL